MKMAMVSFNPKVGDVQTHVKRMTQYIESAVEHQCPLIVFPEMSLVGYPPRDLIFYESLYSEQNTALLKLKRLSKKITIIVGGFTKNKKGGAPFQNVAFVLQNGQKAVYAKQLLPEYDVFDEKRYFEAGEETLILKLGRYKFGLSICEDLWAKDPQMHKLYSYNPLSKYKNQDMDVLINISASPFEHTKLERREKLIQHVAQDLKASVVYVNQSGANDDLIFDGCVMAVNSKGQKLFHSVSFKEELFILDLQNATVLPPQKTKPTDHLFALNQALTVGIRDYFHKSGFHQAVLGLSGGIDSALVAQLATQALGPENVLGVLLPSRYSSQHSLDDARALAHNLKIKTHTVPIDPIHKAFETLFSSLWTEEPSDLTQQNVQARIRGLILMAIANNTSRLLLNTTNKSELAFGYGTLYGDLCGALSVLSDLTKHEVYELAHFLNPQFEFIPQSSLTKPPSAELKPNQKDSDTLPEYSQIDAFISTFVERLESHPEHTLWQKTVLSHEHKRYQAPLGLKVSEKAFGRGWRFPIVQKLFSKK